MTHSPLRDALLNQMGGAAVAAELNSLNELVTFHARRARRLTIWTIIVWLLWFGQLALYFAVPIARTSGPPASQQALQQQPDPAVTAPAATQRGGDEPDAGGSGHPGAPAHSGRRGESSVLGLLGGTLMVGMFLILPPVGIILLILTILAHRSASMSQVRASLVSIDAQLRLLSAQRMPPGSTGS